MTTLFKYETQGRPVTFLDEADQYDNETIRKHWQTSFPELGNCQAETKAAPKGEKLKEVMAEGEEVEVDKVVTFVKKVGTKGGDGDQVDADDVVTLDTVLDAARRFDAWYTAMKENNDALNRRTLEAFGRPVFSDPARQRLIDNAPRMLSELQAQRDLLATLLEVAIFVNGNRQAVIDRLARLEAVLAEVVG
jgi:hypothetical protein